MDQRDRREWEREIHRILILVEGLCAALRESHDGASRRQAELRELLSTLPANVSAATASAIIEELTRSRLNDYRRQLWSEERNHMERPPSGMFHVAPPAPPSATAPHEADPALLVGGAKVPLNSKTFKIVIAVGGWLIFLATMVAQIWMKVQAGTPQLPTGHP